MPSFVPAFLPHLQSNRLAGLDLGPNAIFPSNDGYSLTNLPASICHWLGIPQFGAPRLDEKIFAALPGTYRHVILLVVDGLGLQQFQQFTQIHPSPRANNRFAFWDRLLSEAVLIPLTSIVPSTTSSVLTTLWTGQPPAVHGVMGYEMYLKEYGLIANMITHSAASYSGDVGGLRRAGFQPETFLPVSTLGPHLVSYGVGAHALQHVAIARSGLSTMLFPAVNVIPFRSPGDLWVTLPALLESRASERLYAYVYWSELDDLAHKHGPFDRRVELEFTLLSNLLDSFISEVRKRSHGNTLLLITADHGHIHTPLSSQLEMRNHPEFASCLHLYPSGESRLAYLYVRPGHEERLQRYVETTWPGKFCLLPSAQAAEAGLFGFGPFHPRLAERIGDYVMVAQDHAYLWWADRENPLLGRHGGMSQIEMVVPLIGVVL